ncbi:MAG: HD-GYP domain-containing protein, partial [Ignavibacteriales bacterium]
KKHSELGFNTLRVQDDIPLLSAHVALQHHERWNGTGYPKGLTSTDIHHYARIVAVADVFDALATDKPYRRGYTIEEALEYCKTMAGFYFDPDTTDAMIANIARYPIGSLVRLNSGEIGQVIDIDQELPNRPTLMMIFDGSGRVLARRTEVDLRQKPEANITHLMRDEQTAALVAKIKASR